MLRADDDDQEMMTVVLAHSHRNTRVLILSIALIYPPHSRRDSEISENPMTDNVPLLSKYTSNRKGPRKVLAACRPSVGPAFIRLT